MTKLWRVWTQRPHGPRANPRNHTTTWVAAAETEEQARRLVQRCTTEPVVRVSLPADDVVLVQR